MKYAIALTLILVFSAADAFADEESDDESDKVVCSLSSPDLEGRMSVIDKLAQGIVERKELDDGFAFGFPAEDKWFTAITEIVALERKCCAFFTFRIIVEAGGGPIWLELAGPDGTKEFLRSELGL